MSLLFQTNSYLHWSLQCMPELLYQTSRNQFSCKLSHWSIQNQLLSICDEFETKHCESDMTPWEMCWYCSEWAWKTIMKQTSTFTQTSIQVHQNPIRLLLCSSFTKVLPTLGYSRKLIQDYYKFEKKKR